VAGKTAIELSRAEKCRLAVEKRGEFKQTTRKSDRILGWESETLYAAANDDQDAHGRLIDILTEALQKAGAEGITKRMCRLQSQIFYRPSR
jgi:hypothetical protein